MNRTPYAAVMFDMDGLLLDTERVMLDCFLLARAHFGLPDGTETFLRCVGLTSVVTKDIIVDSLDDRVTLSDFNEIWDEAIRERLHKDVPLRPGARELVDMLADRGVRMGVATSSLSQLANDHLEKAGIRDFLEHVVGRDRVSEPKPSPESYLKLAGLMGTQAAHCAAFEDSNAGTRAALASGATVVQVPDLNRIDGTPTHVIAEDLLSGAVQIGLLDARDLD